MNDDMRKIAEEVARREVTDFGISALGYDRDHAGSDSIPRDDLQWVRQRRRAEEGRKKWYGAVALTLAGAIVALLADFLKKRLLGL